MRSLISLAAEECNISEKWISDVLRAGPSNVKKLRIPKKTPGTFRVVSRPSAELEILQRWLTFRFFRNLDVHEVAMAFVPERSILLNANRHRTGKYFLRVDFKDFFPSIKSPDLVRALLAPGAFGPNEIRNYDGYREFIERVCFDHSNSLPIGYISSPTISNAVMFEFDVQLVQAVATRQAEFGKSTVTRYADDIVFSTDKKGGCATFYEFFCKFVSARTWPKLIINDKKTIFTSKAGGTAIVTGLRVCADSHITVPRDYKDGVRLMLSLHSKKLLKPEDFHILRGHLAYIRHVAPAFFSKLCLKYVGIIDHFL